MEKKHNPPELATVSVESLPNRPERSDPDVADNDGCTLPHLLFDLPADWSLPPGCLAAILDVLMAVHARRHDHGIEEAA